MSASGRKRRPAGRDSAAPVHTWLTEPMPRDVAQSIERLARAPDVCRIAVMPDVHLAENVCVGCVVATRRLVYPQAVGADIGCGMASVALDGTAGALGSEEAAAAVLAGFREAVPILRHRSLTGSPELPAELDPAGLSAASLRAAAARHGRIELGTLGRGNHFLEIQADEDDRLWLTVHSGSRAMGQVISAHHRPVAHSGKNLYHLDATTPEGSAYLVDAAWAERYADQSRRMMLSAAAGVLERVLGMRTSPETLLSCSHNHVRQEPHADEPLLVHRKGASRAGLDEPGIIPGSMGSATFHVAGRGCVESLCSSSHGAGRALSRSDARRRLSGRDVGEQLQGVWFDRRLASSLVEEAPAAYKDIHRVMRAQRELVRIVRVLRPVLCYKGV